MQAQEGFYQRNREVLTATGMRGLAESGQRNVADVQSQTAYGETISGLYGQKQDVEQQAVQQSQAIEQVYQQTVDQANVQRAQQELQSNEQLYAQMQSIDENKKAQIAELMMASMEGIMTPEQVKSLADVYGITEEELTTVMNVSSYYDPTGSIEYKEAWDWPGIATIAAGVATGTVAGAPGGPIGIAIGATAGALGAMGIYGGLQSDAVKLKDSKGNVAFEGGRMEVLAQVADKYTSMPNSDQIKPAWDQKGNDRIVFIYNGTPYATYNEALAASRGQAVE